MKRTRNFGSTGRTPRGFTAVELLMALAIFAIGATGILAMQLIASHTNTHAKNVATATQLAVSWQDNLAMDALAWRGEALDTSPPPRLITNTRWLTQVGTVAAPGALNGVWHTPVNNDTGTFGPGADPRGNYVDYTTGGAFFCTHIRLTRVLSANYVQVLRSEVRVFWPKGEVSWTTGADYCTANLADVVSVGAATSQFHFVYNTTAIRQTPSF